MIFFKSSSMHCWIPWSQFCSCSLLGGPLQPTKSPTAGGSLQLELSMPAPCRGPLGATLQSEGEPQTPSPNRLYDSSFDQPSVQRKEPKIPLCQQGEYMGNYLLLNAWPEHGSVRCPAKSSPHSLEKLWRSTQPWTKTDPTIMMT